MKQLLFICLLAFASMTYAQEDQQVGWSKGDVLAGANTILNNTSLLNVSLSPTVGYALTDADMILATVFLNELEIYTVLNYQIVYQRRLVDGLYVGAGYKHVTTPIGERVSGFASSVGFYKQLGKNWYVSPQLAYDLIGGGEHRANNAILTTQITFGIVL